MELTQLRYFLEVASSQHITHSAEKLHIAQPALTQTIHRLEDEIGVALFEAKGRNIVLTEYGKFLFNRLSPALEHIDRTVEELRRMAKLSSKTIRVGVGAASAILTEAIIEFKKDTDVNFSLFQCGDVSDIELNTRMSGEKGKDEFTMSEKIFLAIPADHSLSVIKLSELEGVGFICLLGSRQFRYICDKYCHHVGFKPKIIFESDNPATVRNMIGANMGVGFWPEFTWGHVGDRVRLVEIEGLSMSREIVLKLNPKSGAKARDFFEFLKAFLSARKKALSQS